MTVHITLAGFLMAVGALAVGAFVLGVLYDLVMIILFTGGMRNWWRK